MKIDTDDIAALTDPLTRVRASDIAMKLANEMLEELSIVKGDALREFLDTHSGDELAAILGITRTSIYRAAAKGLGKCQMGDCPNTATMVCRINWTVNVPSQSEMRLCEQHGACFERK